MARLYSRATRTVAALILSPTRAISLSVVGIGLAIFAGQHLTSARRNVEKGANTDRPDPDREEAEPAANDGSPQARDKEN